MNQKYLLLKNIQDDLLKSIDPSFQRTIASNINWDESLIGLIGERGLGKTYLMLQKLKEKQKWFYFSADNPIIKSEGLFKFVYWLYVELWLTTFFIDEIHKYPNWTNEIKNLFDSIPKHKIVFSGSSSLDLYKGVLDLGRRASFYNFHYLNFAEYLKLFKNLNAPSFSLEEILTNHQQISLKFWHFYKESYWQKYLQQGHYPFGVNLKHSGFINRMQLILDKIILEDLPVFLNFQTLSLDKLRKLFYFIANSTPSELSFTHLAKKIWLDKSIVENSLVLLSKIGLISLVPKFGNVSERVRKEYKILLGNSNLYQAYNLQTDPGILRESFFVSCLKRIKFAEVYLPQKWDFILQIMEKIYRFEVGGKSKQKSKYPTNTYIIKDDISTSNDQHIIPLWLFGLLKAE